MRANTIHTYTYRGHSQLQLILHLATVTPKLANPVNRTINATKSTKRRLFDDGEGSAPKKSVRKVLKFM